MTDTDREGEFLDGTSQRVVGLTKRVKKRKKRKRLRLPETSTPALSSSVRAPETDSGSDRWSPTGSEEEVIDRPRDSRCYFYVDLSSLQQAPAQIIHIHRLLGYMISTPKESDIPDPTPAHRLARIKAREEITEALSDLRGCINRYFRKR